MRGREKEEDYLCGRVFTCAADWLEDNHANGPFMLWVDSFDPHEPWDPPDEYVAKYSSGYNGLDLISPNSVKDRTAAESERAGPLFRRSNICRQVGWSSF